MWQNRIDQTIRRSSRDIDSPPLPQPVQRGLETKSPQQSRLQSSLVFHWKRIAV